MCVCAVLNGDYQFHTAHEEIIKPNIIIHWFNFITMADPFKIWEGGGEVVTKCFLLFCGIFSSNI